MNALAAPRGAVNTHWELTGPAACADEALQRIFARDTARGMKLELDEQRIRNYRWGSSAQSRRVVVAMHGAKGRTA